MVPTDLGPTPGAVLYRLERPHLSLPLLKKCQVDHRESSLTTSCDFIALGSVAQRKKTPSEFPHEKMNHDNYSQDLYYLCAL